MLNESSLHAKRLRPDFALVELQDDGIDIVDEQTGQWPAAVDEFLRTISA
jgi:hypothetical protein